MSLAAVGGIAAALAGERSAAWPVRLRLWATSGPRPPHELNEAILRELEGGDDVAEDRPPDATGVSLEKTGRAVARAGGNHGLAHEGDWR
jgi:hypothetical protein